MGGLFTSMIHLDGFQYGEKQPPHSGYYQKKHFLLGYIPTTTVFYPITEDLRG